MATRFRQGAGRLSLDFVRTFRFRGTDHPIEELPDLAAVTVWIDQCVPHAEGPTGATGAAEARAVREAIHELITAAWRGERISAAARDLVNGAAARPVPVPRMDAGGGVRWHADDLVSAALALLARDALELVASPHLARLRKCAGTGCSALFLDLSRPGKRRWCSMDHCGNRAKKETLRRHAGRS
ncbi:CGNR zinc finger domain-containing protein [Spirillospora sp. CA-128828]|uniref:CGNR zinc finger domain-containing protein n=1 Tax=Spirillospora sp. CA-128828 TaxID=3240033 RepID=UPI003D920F6F